MHASMYDHFCRTRPTKYSSSRNLINVHEQNLPDPYVRLYLMPDHKKDKKKTKSIHDSIHPVYEDLYANKRRIFPSVNDLLHL